MTRTVIHRPLTATEGGALPSHLMAVPIGSRTGLVGFFVVDAEDFDLVAEYSWNLSGQKARPYPRSTCGRVHRLILGLTSEDEAEVDHIDGNQFNNSRSNLRICDRSVNMQNRRAFVTSKSGIKGVCWMPKQKLWCAYLNVRGSVVHKTYHHEKRDAITARKSAEVEHGITALQGVAS